MSGQRHVIVSGGSRGLGLEIAVDLLEHGYSVSTFSRKRADAVDSLESSFPGQFHFGVADLEISATIARSLDAACAKLGPPWGLVNNAAIARDALLVALPEVQLMQQINVNLTGTLLLTRVALRKMLLKRKGRVINITSIVSQRGFRGLAVYGATKAGLDAATRALAREVGALGITVNSIAPGFLETEMSAGLDEPQRVRIVNRTPLGRLGRPADCVPAIRFLLSDEAAFITGQVVMIDGGAST